LDAIRAAITATFFCSATFAGTGAAATEPPLAQTVTPPLKPAAAAQSNLCLTSGDGYLRAHVAGALDADIDWPNSGTHCEGEAKTDPVGVRLSFRRTAASRPNLLFVFGVTGVREGESARSAATNLTIFVQGSSRVYSTRGDARCTVDSLTQRRLDTEHRYRLEARGFCIQPAHAVHGEGDVLVSRFDFAGIVNYLPPDADAPPDAGVSPAPSVPPDAGVSPGAQAPPDGSVPPRVK
jgi:hypothetical protein